MWQWNGSGWINNNWYEIWNYKIRNQLIITILINNTTTNTNIDVFVNALLIMITIDMNFGDLYVCLIRFSWTWCINKSCNWFFVCFSWEKSGLYNNSSKYEDNKKITSYHVYWSGIYWRQILIFGTNRSQDQSKRKVIPYVYKWLMYLWYNYGWCCQRYDLWIIILGIGKLLCWWWSWCMDFPKCVGYC